MCYNSGMTTVVHTREFDNGDASHAKRERARLIWFPLIAFAALLALVPFYMAALDAHFLDMAFLSSICGTNPF